MAVITRKGATLLRAHATCSQVQSTNSKGGPDARVTFETFLPLLQVIITYDFSTWGLPGFEPGLISLAKQILANFVFLTQCAFLLLQLTLYGSRSIT